MDLVRGGRHDGAVGSALARKHIVQRPLPRPRPRPRALPVWLLCEGRALGHHEGSETSHVGVGHLRGGREVEVRVREAREREVREGREVEVREGWGGGDMGWDDEGETSI